MSSPATFTTTRRQPVTVYIGLGANLASEWGTPLQTLQQAATRLRVLGVFGFRLSNFYRSTPQNCPADSPDFINAVAELKVAAESSPRTLLKALQGIENECGRQRSAERNAPRVLDLDLLAFGQQQLDDPELTLPHPRLHERAFVLVPLQELNGQLRLAGLAGSVQELLTGIDPDPLLLKI